MERLISFLGLFFMIFVAWLSSVDRGAVRWRPVVWGVFLQLLLGAVVLMPALQQFFFTAVDEGVRGLLSFSEAGADFVFQTVEPHRILVGFEGDEAQVFIGHISPPLKTFAFWILPSIIFFSSLMAVLYHLGVMQVVVRAIAWVMQWTMGTSGAESLSTAANIFLGQTESPLVVKPFVPNMTRSELHAVMVGGFATVAGGVMAAYVSFLKDIPGIAGHLATASILAAPATLAIAKIVVPETEVPVTADARSIELPRTTSNVMEAAAQGASEGVSLAMNVAGMLIAFVALTAMVDAGLGVLPDLMGEPLSLSRVFGWFFVPFALAMGVPWDECRVVGVLLGEKLVLTELMAYLHLAKVQASATPLSERSALIASYALCGFANFASVGIQIGGIGAMAPARMGDLSRLGLRAMWAGSLASFQTACVVGVFS